MVYDKSCWQKPEVTVKLFVNTAKRAAQQMCRRRNHKNILLPQQLCIRINERIRSHKRIHDGCIVCPS